MERKNTKKKKNTRSSHRPPLPRRSEDPWLVCTHGEHRTTQSFYSISEDRYYSRSIPELNNNEIVACSHGWLVMLSKESYGLNCFLLNPLSMRKIKLPQRMDFRFNICILTSAPPNSNCVVVFFEHEGSSIMSCRPGDKEWTTQELPLERIYGEGADGISEAVTCGGKIYGIVRRKSKLVVIDVDDGGELTLRHQGGIEEVPDRSLSYWVSGTSKHLVESCGELFFVLILYTVSNSLVGKAREYGMFKIPRIEVFKLDFEQLVWKKVKTLGNHRAFLLGMSNSLSCPSSSSSTTRTTATTPTNSESAEEEEGVKTNCIYFIESTGDKKLYVYNMEEGTIAVSYLFPSVVHNMYGPDWILPICNH